MNNTTRIQEAVFSDMPPDCRECLADGSILYSEENNYDESVVITSKIMASSRESGRTITPKLRLREHDKKPLLFSTRKWLFPGSLLIRRSMHIKAAPIKQANQVSFPVFSSHAMDLPTPLRAVIIQPRVSLWIAMWISGMPQCWN
jgi:hypothetical protein